jgi:hypothetical protein
MKQHIHRLSTKMVVLLLLVFTLSMIAVGFPQTTAQAAPHHSGVRPAVASQPADAVQVQYLVPHTADACAGSVCIQVYGGGLYVSDWNTSVSNTSQKCTHAHFWVNGANVYTSGEQCGDSDFTQTWTIEDNYKNGTKLCNTWDGFKGKPCVYVWK